MAWFNEEVAALLRGYAELTQITGGDVFRARNYEKGAALQYFTGSAAHGPDRRGGQPGDHGGRGPAARI